MKQTFQIFTLEQYNEFCEFINGLTKRNKKHHITPWLKEKDNNGGFVVWFYN